MDMSVVHPPSACPSCHHQIRWYENIPVLSYLLLKGRCSHCRFSISAQYPLIELAAGSWSVAIAHQWLWPVFSQPELWVSELHVLLSAAATWLWYSTFVCGLLAVSLIDLRYTFVPDEISLNLSWLSLGAFFIPMSAPLDHLFGLISGYMVILCIRWLGYLMYKREAMGLGDAKLLAFIGGFLGWQVLPWILFAAAVQGLIAAMIALSFTKLTGRGNLLTMTADELDQRFGEELSSSQNGGDQSRVMLVMPFGPFLCLGAFEVLMISQERLLHYLSLLH